MDRSKAFEAENGFLVENGPFLTGGASSPVGSILGQPGDFYVQNDGSKPIIWFCTGTGVNDWRLAHVKDFVNIYSIETHTSTLNGTETLTVNSVTLHRIIGSATGYSVQLPDATTLTQGRRFEISNESTETIELKDGAGAVLFEVIAGSFAVATLENGSGAGGTWIVTIIGDAATGIISYSVGSDTLFSTTSSTDVLITGMTVTPVSGRYAVWFSSDIEISQNNRIADVVLYRGGTAVERTRREVQGVSSNFKSALQTLAEIFVNGSEAVDVRVNVTAGNLKVNQRRLILIRLGA